MKNQSRIDEERGLYRPEVIAYQKRRAFGEPIDSRPLAPGWGLVPMGAIALLGWLCLSVTYQPRLEASFVPQGREAVAVLSIRDRPELLADLRSGAEVDFQLKDSGRAHRLRVLEVRDGGCQPPKRCMRIEGELMTSESPRVEVLTGPSEAVVLLPSRPLF
ncbi:hypothetical protein NR800_09135 [Corallococcus interemptor]|uniref:hypothetical protein n=1 Tax=Corallococcus TaxID=83461 RepID=UPI0035D45E30